MPLGCSIYIYIMFRMDNTQVYVIYELGMFVWFVLFYVTDLDFGFIDFQVSIIVTVELGVYIILIYYAMYLFYFFIFCLIIMYG